MTESKAYRTLIFMRHGETISNTQMVASGGEENPRLTQAGYLQATSAIEILKDNSLQPGVIITSDRMRTMHTARVLVKHFKVELKLNDDLNERMLGDWNGVKHNIVNPMLAAGKTPPNGESRAEFRARTIQALNNCMNYIDQTPMVIGSRGTARILLQFVGDPNAAGFPNGGILKVEVADADRFDVLGVEYLR